MFDILDLLALEVWCSMIQIPVLCGDYFASECCVGIKLLYATSCADLVCYASKCSLIWVSSFRYEQTWCNQVENESTYISYRDDYWNRFNICSGKIQTSSEKNNS